MRVRLNILKLNVNTMIEWYFFPQNLRTPEVLAGIAHAFIKIQNEIDSEVNQLSSNEVLSLLTPLLEELEFKVEKSKKKSDKISVPVLFGKNGKPEKTFDVDAYNERENTVLEVEAGRAYLNNQFLKDLFQACMMVDVSYLAIAVRRSYLGNNDFNEIVKFIDSLYASRRLELPLKGLMIIGY